MSKFIKKIVITVEGINVISEINGVNSITQLNFNGSAEDVKKILDKHNISDIMNYEFDEKIVRALAIDESGEQLRDYLEICRQVSYGAKNLVVAENMPEIEYDLRSLRKYE